MASEAGVRDFMSSAPGIGTHSAPGVTAAGGRARGLSPGVRAIATPRLAILLVCATCLGSATAAATEPTQLPADVRATVVQLQAAAEASDFATLRSLMTDAFTWSFGGDADADQAITAWRVDPGYLTALRATLARGCRLLDQNEVECPGRGDGGFRAGLVRTSSGWRMQYLVEGD
jgi:hypothetical protein